MSDKLFFTQLAQQIQTWALELGFEQVGICDTNLENESAAYQAWLAQNYHGSMQWLQNNAEKRLHPEQLVEGAVRVISVRMNYLPGDTRQIHVLKSPEKAYISRYALGRDYHKLIRKRLAKLAEKIRLAAESYLPAQQRPFVDSAPVMERPLAEKAGLGWTGKHTLIINPKAGSWFFLGEILTSLPLPTTNKPIKNQCGSCDACLKVCPTDAFPKPYQLDARRCISYLTIENKQTIPVEFREPMGNRVFGCDDCQAICPWNKFAQTTEQQDFHPRHQLDNSDLLDLFNWTEEQFLKNTEGSAIRRIGHTGWLRNLSVGLGNAPSNVNIIEALQTKLENTEEPMLSEHFSWALTQQQKPSRTRKRKLKNLNKAPRIGEPKQE